MLFLSLARQVLSATVSPCGMGSMPESDRRLKADVTPIDALDNGLMLYTFRYQGSDVQFTGVMAQDVLAQDDLRHAVTLERDGYYRVNYTALGLGHLVTPLMLREGRKAARRMH